MRLKFTVYSAALAARTRNIIDATDGKTYTVSCSALIVELADASGNAKQFEFIAEDEASAAALLADFPVGASINVDFSKE